MSGWEAVWATLGIEATADPAAIRRAYARRLKTIDQAREPEAFAALRGAYEAALNAARSSPEIRPAASFRETPVPSLTPQPAKAPERPPAIGAILRAITARDVVSAARLLCEARQALELPLAEDMALANRLLLALSHDHTLDGAAVEEAALMLGWHSGGEDYRRSPEMDRLTRRLDAEDWYRTQRAAAGSWRIRFTNRGMAARLLLGKGRIPLAWRVIPGAALMQAFAAHGVYGLWLRNRFDADRMAHLDEILKSRRALVWRKVMPRVSRFLLRFWRALIILVLALSWIWQNFGR